MQKIWMLPCTQKTYKSATNYLWENLRLTVLISQKGTAAVLSNSVPNVKFSSLCQVSMSSAGLATDMVWDLLHEVKLS